MTRNARQSKFCQRRLTPTAMACFAWLALGAICIAQTSGDQVVYEWAFTNSVGGSVAGPVTGTIAFSTLVLGDGGTHAPSSFIIDSAPGHTFINGYVLGDEVVGSALWQDISQSGVFDFNAANEAISGDFAFREPVSGVLLMDFRSPAQTSFFRSPGQPNHITQGTAEWTLIIPEPGGTTLGIAMTLMALFARRAPLLARPAVRKRVPGAHSG